MEKQIDQIINRQIARLLDHLKPLNIPPIAEDAIKKYFNYANIDIKALVKGDMEHGNNKESQN